MTKFGAWRRGIYVASDWIYAGCLLISTALGWVNSLDGEELWLKDRTILQGYVFHVQELSIWLYVLIGVVCLICFIIKRRGDPWIYEKLQFILDEYQGKVFSNGTPKDHDRVTIFEHRKNCLFARHWSANAWYRPWGNKKPFSDYLVPIMRSGHISQRSRAIFYAPDESDKAEGVAAMAWARRAAVILNDLPEITATTGRRDKEKYARTTKCDMGLLDRYIADGRQPPRSIAAMPIDRNGKLWGVVVLDSRSPQGVTDTSVSNYTLTVALIGHLLERA